MYTKKLVVFFENYIYNTLRYIKLYIKMYLKFLLDKVCFLKKSWNALTNLHLLTINLIKYE